MRSRTMTNSKLWIFQIQLQLLSHLHFMSVKFCQLFTFQHQSAAFPLEHFRIAFPLRYFMIFQLDTVHRMLDKIIFAVGNGDTDVCDLN